MSRQKKQWMLFGAVVGAGLGYATWLNRRLFTVNDVKTGESAAYPQLNSHVYHTNAEETQKAAVQSIEHLTRWRVMHSDEENGIIDAEVETAIGGFLDDVTVFVSRLDPATTRVVIRSRSRQGRGDLGQNAAHIRELQAEMDRRLTAGAAI